jgi:hypothetical protein
VGEVQPGGSFVLAGVGFQAVVCRSLWCFGQGCPRLLIPVVPPWCQARRWSASVSREVLLQPGNGHFPSRIRSQARIALGTR